MPSPDRQIPGDLGAGCAPGLPETRLAERALRERWPIPPDVRIRVLNRLGKILDDDAWTDADRPGHREVTSAARALIAADKLNLEQAKLDLLAPDDDAPPHLTIRVERIDRGLVPPASDPDGSDPAV